MGLFKKRSTDPGEMERLKADIASMGARLSASDQAKDELRQQVDGLTTRIERPIAPPPTEPPPPPTSSIDPAQLNIVNAKIERLNARIDDVAHDDGTPPAPTVDPDRVDEIASAFAQLTNRVDSVETQSADTGRVDDLQASLQRLTDRLDEVDARITSISTELANQISEMSGELETLGANEPATDEVVDELRDAQTRLAGEQARYQIAFRQDLAQLADRLKRS